MSERIKNITSFIRTRINDFSPRVGIVLGSGLGGLADKVSHPICIPYSSIDGFPKSTVEGHKGQFVFGKLCGVDIVCMQGRFHFYEGHPIEDTVIGIRVMAMLGIDTIIVSNAAGGVGEHLNVGDIMLINDHINLLPNPLIGKNDNRWGVRFPAMNNAYDKQLQKIATICAKKINISLKQGVYLASSGPSYETMAEYRFFKTIGADACGMSTVPEVIVANHIGLKVVGFSVITNAPFANIDAYTDHQEVQFVAGNASENMEILIETMLYECYK